MDAGTQGSSFSAAASYVQDSFLMQHTVTYAQDAVETGKIYNFRVKSQNEKGYSDYSELFSIACSAPPQKANAPQVDYSLSSRESIYIQWSLNTDGLGDGGVIQGYKVYMDDGYGGALQLVMDTVGLSSTISEYMATNLTQSLQYRFQVEAYNYNLLAPGEKSDITSIYACDIPYIDQRPNKVDTS
jgi:hypothetical protein